MAVDEVRFPPHREANPRKVLSAEVRGKESEAAVVYSASKGLDEETVF